MNYTLCILLNPLLLNKWSNLSVELFNLLEIILRFFRICVLIHNDEQSIHFVIFIYWQDRHHSCRCKVFLIKSREENRLSQAFILESDWAALLFYKIDKLTVFFETVSSESVLPNSFVSSLIPEESDTSF